MENYRIKCGKCNTEYTPRGKQNGKTLEEDFDYSCPLCKHGKMLETQILSPNKQILKG